jgi:glycosyltransferase involved in cell wall biosynthesis
MRQPTQDEARLHSTRDEARLHSTRDEARLHSTRDEARLHSTRDEASAATACIEPVGPREGRTATRNSPSAAPRRRVLYVCDALGDDKAGGLVAARRLVSALGPHHDVLTLGVGAQVPLSAVRLPVGAALVRKNGFTFAHPDDALLLRALAWADVVHLQLPTWLSFRALHWARLMGVPVLAAHHLQPENVLHQLGFNLAPLARFLNGRLVRHYFQKADLVVCPTAFARGELERAGLTVRSAVVSNGVPAHFVPAAARVPSSRFRVVSVGRHAPEKKHAVLVEAVLRMKHRARVSLVVGGKGPLTERLQRQAAPLGVDARVGFLDDAQLLGALQQADLVVHPSEVELEGLAVAEALACGTPVLVSDARSNAAAAFAHDTRFLFRASDAADLARRLDFWVERRDALEALRPSHAARGANLKLSAAAQQMAQLYAALADRRHPR